MKVPLKGQEEGMRRRWRGRRTKRSQRRADGRDEQKVKRVEGGWEVPKRMNGEVEEKV